MSELLGLLASLEAMVIAGKKVPLTDKVVLEERKVLQLLDKIKLAIQSQDLIRKTVDITKHEEVKVEHHRLGSNSPVVIDATEKADQIKKGANEYADYVLANLQLMLIKIQKDLIKLEKNIESGRELLEKQQKEF